MNHVEFFVLWDDNSWSVEGVNVEPAASLDETLHVAREAMRLEADRDCRGLTVVGPVYCCIHEDEED